MPPRSVTELLLPKAAVLPRTNVPSLILTPPLNVFEPLSVVVPVPVRVRLLPPPVLFALPRLR